VLNDEQKYAAFEMHSNSIISASPGSGKTKTLVARAEQKLDSLPSMTSLALITYTNAAADEIASRLVTHKTIFIGTIHKFCLEYILRPFSWIYGWEKPRIVTYDELVDFTENNETLNLTIDDLSLLRKTTSGNIDVSVDWNNPNDITIVGNIYYMYLQSIKALDFNEVLYRSFKLINENSFVAVSLSNKFYEILIDEFQDTSNFQYSIFKIINDAGPITFFMVGDERQSIYRFAGALNHPFENAKEDFLSEEQLLTKTYRSTNIIVDTYCALFDDHPTIENLSDNRDLNIPVIIQETNNQNHSNILEYLINQLHNDKNISLNEIAILSARWFDSFNSSCVLRRNYNVVGLGALPHHSRNLNNSTYNLLRTIVRFIYYQSIGRLRAIKRGIDLHSLENNLSLDDKTISLIQNQILNKFSMLNLSNSLNEGLLKVTEIFNDAFKIDHILFKEIIERISDEELPLWSLEKYFKTLSGVDGITINTIHQAKGLEYDAVILDQMNVGKIPYQFWDRTNRVYLPLTEESIGDGRKLFYVALSRAKKYLIVLHNWNPSMFIEQIRN
jgi:superfamily I DNA/RNA helicase